MSAITNPTASAGLPIVADVNLINGVTNLGGDFLNATRSLSNGIVTLTGLVVAPAQNLVITVLPEGWRPNGKVRLYQVAGAVSLAAIDISPNGEVVLFGPNIDINCSICGSFIAQQ